MRQSKLFTKTTKTVPKDETSLNAQLLLRAGFIDKLAAGIYTYLPLGLRVLRKIQDIIREEMDRIGGQEILLPALTPKELWQKTNRWNNFDALFKVISKEKKEYALGATHEEVVTPLVQKFLFSYKDLPMAVYQIQDKFRDEKRARSGLLRGREFNMKDLYSFHRDEKDLNDYYETVKKAYFNVFKRCGLDTHLVEATGGAFSPFSHEFQVLTDNGEDLVYFCESCQRHQNQELVENEAKECPYCQKKRERKRAIEVGNIFKLGTRFSDAFALNYLDEAGKKQSVIMGCYGLGPSRIMGAAVEVLHDKDGMIWPSEIAPFDVHLLFLENNVKIRKIADGLYEELRAVGQEVLYDDRDESAGVKLKDSDLLGLPIRLVVSERTVSQNAVELKRRTAVKVELIARNAVPAKL